MGEVLGARNPTTIREHCRNWIEETHNRCGKPADCIVWGKLLPPETLGPRCYDCAEAHFGYHNVHDRDGRGYAIYHLPRPDRGVGAEHAPKEHP